MQILKNVFPQLLAGVIIICASCGKTNDSTTSTDGDWSRASDFEGAARTEAVSFTIGDIVFVGGGFDGTDRRKDFWAFNATTGTWTQKADMPGVPRSSAAAFALNGRGYVGTGYDGTDKLKDFWEYNPETNSWLQKADFGGTARYGAVAFAVNGKGYMGTGYDANHLKDLWEYNVDSNKWAQKASLGGTKRVDAAVFVINDKAYIVGGLNNGAYPNDFWMYDATGNEWTEKRKVTNVNSADYDNSYTGINRSNAATFVMDNKGYLICGETNGITGTVWEYDPSTDLWKAKTALEATARTGAVAFTVKGIGYVATGSNSSYRFDDLWKFTPTIKKIDNN
jgi:N-acetylneuraminic acid mutarotase